MRKTPASSPPSIGHVIHNALAFNFQRSQGVRMNADTILQTVDDLFALLEERRVEYLLVGGIAMLTYIEGRNTEDINLILSADSLQQIPEIVLVDQDKDFARGNFRDLQIDVLLTENQLFSRVQKDFRAVQPFAERSIPCATVEGLILLKLYALPSLYRQGDFARVGLYENDIATLIQRYQPPLDPLLNILAQHVDASDLAELRGIIKEIEGRISRFNAGHSAS
jgi:hypothetical protein